LIYSKTVSDVFEVLIPIRSPPPLVAPPKDLPKDVNEIVIRRNVKTNFFMIPSYQAIDRGPGEL
jgi:hypothetical protein